MIKISPIIRDDNGYEHIIVVGVQPRDRKLLTEMEQHAVGLTKLHGWVHYAYFLPAGGLPINLLLRRPVDKRKIRARKMHRKRTGNYAQAPGKDAHPERAPIVQAKR